MTLTKQNSPDHDATIDFDEKDNEVLHGEFFSWEILPACKNSPHQQVILSLRGLFVDIHSTFNQVLGESSSIHYKLSEGAIFYFGGHEYILFKEPLSQDTKSSSDMSAFNRYMRAKDEWKNQLLELNKRYAQGKKSVGAREIVYVTKESSFLKWSLTAAAVIAMGAFIGTLLSASFQNSGGDMCFLDDWEEVDIDDWDGVITYPLEQDRSAMTFEGINLDQGLTDLEEIKASIIPPKSAGQIKSVSVGSSYQSDSTGRLVATSYIDSQTLLNLMRLSIFNSIPVGDLNKEGNRPYLAFTRITDSTTNDLLASTESQGHTGLLIPFDLDAKDEETQMLAIARTVVAYCSRNADVDQLSIMFALEDFSEQNVVESQQGGYRQKNAPPIGECEWETVLSNMGTMKAMMSVAGAQGVDAHPFVVSSTGAILSLEDTESVTAESLVQWLNSN